MIVKIIPHPEKSASFPAVGYNTGKVDKSKGELMLVSGFGPLQALHHLRPEDYKNYLKMVSATNRQVKFPQFHAVISAKGLSYDKHALTAIAQQWLTAMGYGEQPYLVIYHKDTDHNHVHLVSTRVSKNGKKISDRFENIRAVHQLNRVLGMDEKQTAQADAAQALTYQFATRAQLMMILESKGYILRESAGMIELIRFGRKQGEVPLQLVAEKLKEYSPNEHRKVQLKALFHKYALLTDTAIVKNTGSYASAFSDLMKNSFGIELLFHASGDKSPYGYTVIDHAKKQVFKGGEIMPLKELLSCRQQSGTGAKEAVVVPEVAQPVSGKLRAYYAAILKAALLNYPDLVQGLQHQGLVIIRNGEDFKLHDPGSGVFIDTKELLNDKEYREIHRQQPGFPGIYITPDVDDEAINGRNRRRKKKARTNTR